MTVMSQVFNSLMDGQEITGEQIAELIRENTDRHTVQRNLYERFKVSKAGVPILTRTFPIQNSSKIDNRLANDFFGDIVNTKVGYFVGKPISYVYTETDAGGEVVKSTDGDLLLKGFFKRNHMADLDTETAKMAAIAGLAARYCYIDINGEASMINVPPWECIFICDEIGVSDSPFAIRYYTVERGQVKYTKVEFIDDEKISYWIAEGDVTKGTTFIRDPEEEENPYYHLMGSCPLIAFPNNEEMLGDAERVLTLIDGYDRTISDVNSEIEQFRLAYLAFYGTIPNNEDLDKLRQTGVVGFPNDSGNDRAEYITKNLNDVAIENHLNRLDENIIYFAQSVRFTDEAFGQASGVAMKFKLFNLESKCMIAENKFRKSLYHQFTALKGYFEKRGLDYDPYTFEFVFTRNFPLNLTDELTALATGKGLISDKTLYEQMSFVDDPEREIAQVKAEQDEYNKAQAELMQAEIALNQVQQEEQPNIKKGDD